MHISFIGIGLLLELLYSFHDLLNLVCSKTSADGQAFDLNLVCCKTSTDGQAFDAALVEYYK